MDHIKRSFLIFFILISTLATGLNLSAKDLTRQTDHVFIIVLDGVRTDKLAKVNTPNIDRLRQNGVSFSEAVTTYPTDTIVNFVTISTGCYPEKHGVVGQNFMSDDWKQVSFTKNDIKVETLAEIINKSGLKTGFFAAKGYDLLGGRGSTIAVDGKKLMTKEKLAHKYSSDVSGSRQLAYQYKIDLGREMTSLAIEAMKKTNLNFFILNIPVGDFIGHAFGSESSEYLKGLEEADQMVGDLTNAAAKIYDGDRITWFITSDHGFAGSQIDEHVMDDCYRTTLPALNEKNISHSLLDCGGLCVGIFLKDPSNSTAVYNFLKTSPWADKIYTNLPIKGRSGTIQDLHVYNKKLSPQFLIDLANNYSMCQMYGHGSNGWLDKNISLIFSGAGIKSGMLFKKARVIDIAPTVLWLLGIDYDKEGSMDGKILRKAIKN